MRRFFIDEKYLKAKAVTFKGDEAHHIRDVIRLRPGDRFLGLDGKGRVYTLCVRSSGETVIADIEKVSIEDIKTPRVLLACALPKKNKMDDIVEKAAELGAAVIIPMMTSRTVVKPGNEQGPARKQRWERIALEASKQCGRKKLPEIYEPMDFKDALSFVKNNGYDKKIIPYLGEGVAGMGEILSGGYESAAVFIGPEGDFTEAEIKLAIENGFKPVTLGPLVLKVDTACVFVLSVLNYMSS